MKNSKLIFSAIILSVIGGVIGSYISNQYLTSQSISINQQNNSDHIFSKPVNYINEASNSKHAKFNDLTIASDIAVKAVVHIKTHFVREEITIDPFLNMFYGKEAYKIKERHGKSSGSGVIMTHDGYIVTNYHVVQDAKEITVMVNQKRFLAKIIGTDPSTDLAVLKIEAKGLDFVNFGDSDKLNLGEWVVAVGNPLNLQSTVTAGIVSAKNRNIDLLSSNYNPKEKIFPVESFIQTDAAVNSGNSGGALVNREGELIGVNTAIASGTGFYTGYSFAIPSNIVKKVAFDLITYGEVKRVQLGINLIRNNSDIEHIYRLSSEKGLLITNVIEGGNAYNSGLKSMDIILSVDGKSVNSVSELQASVVLNNPGDKVNITVLRKGQSKDFNITMNI